MGREAAAVWNGKLVEMYEISQEKQLLRGIGMLRVGGTMLLLNSLNLSNSFAYFFACTCFLCYFCWKFNCLTRVKEYKAKRYESTNTTMPFTGNWSCETSLVAVHQQNVYTLDGQKAQVRTMQVC